MRIDTDTLATRSREELLRRSLCAGESSVEYVLYSEESLTEAVLGSPKSAHPVCLKKMET